VLEFEPAKNAGSAVNGAKNSASSAKASTPNREFAPGHPWAFIPRKHATDNSGYNSGNSGSPDRNGAASNSAAPRPKPLSSTDVQADYSRSKAGFTPTSGRQPTGCHLI
jgi:hypothetical protein